jgi:hypothetical protein
MTPRSFWSFLIKILGLYVAVQSITTIWKSISLVIIYASLGGIVAQYHMYVERLTYSLSATAILVITYILLFYLCLFKTDWLIDKLKLDKRLPEERLEFNIDSSTILKIVIMLIGGYLLIDIVPNFINDVVFYFQKPDKYEIGEHNRNTGYMIANLVKIGIGVYMLTYSASIANFIEKGGKKEESAHIEEPEPKP